MFKAAACRRRLLSCDSPLHHVVVSCSENIYAMRLLLNVKHATGFDVLIFGAGHRSARSTRAYVVCVVKK